MCDCGFEVGWGVLILGIYGGFGGLGELYGCYGYIDIGDLDPHLGLGCGLKFCLVL